MKRRQVQKHKLSMTATNKASKTTPPGRKRHHRRRCCPTNMVQIFTRRLAREGRKGRKDDAIKKVTGAPGRRRHRSTIGSKAFATAPLQPRADGQEAARQRTPSRQRKPRHMTTESGKGTRPHGQAKHPKAAVAAPRP